MGEVALNGAQDGSQAPQALEFWPFLQNGPEGPGSLRQILGVLCVMSVCEVPNGNALRMTST